MGAYADYAEQTSKWRLACLVKPPEMNVHGFEPVC